MSTALRRLVISILGLLAGVAAWPLMELILSYQHLFPSYFLFSLAQGALFGVVMGAFFGSGEGLTAKERGKIIHGTLMGAATGAAGGIVGFLAGQGILFLVVQQAFTSYRSQQMIAVPLARIVGWAILGIAVGASEGLRARSLKKTLVGAGGGFLGGVLGGASIEYVRTLYPELLYTRLVGLAVFGLLIGICYSLLERGVSLGILRVLNGPRRGKEYSFVQNRVSVGSDNKNDIVLDNYSYVAPKHARFRVRGKDVYIQHIDVKKGAKIYVNERPVETEQLLKYEDVIQIGSAKLFFKTE
ncbi:MAG: FHA domain-containing protein [Spirochaetaceae bacterium]|nr:FHA domain-containing protein [Spirochaetaceae bacterium]MCF7947959.1 FHA domain-containing protein [Spirochaetia bacterium]MCF7951256.1 FHA domain-containing protein [Spirochaetaceae bacterium]